MNRPAAVGTMSSDSSPSTEPQNDSASLVAPLLTWCVIVLTPLALSAFHIELWARVAEPVEQFALPLMFMAQWVAVSLLFPWLFRSSRASLFVLVSSVLMLELAGWMSDSTTSECWTSVLWITLWIGAFMGVQRATKSIRTQQIAVAISGSTAIGALVLFYLRAEFRGSEIEIPKIAITSALIAWLIVANILPLFTRLLVKPRPSKN